MSNISNRTFDNSQTTHHLDVTLQGVLTAFAIILSLLTNGLIVLLWFYFRSLRTAANCPILNLAIKGLLDAVLNGLTLFLFLLPIRRELKYSYAILNSFQVVECFFYILNVLSILIVMQGRYCAVVHKLKYYVWNTKHKSVLTIILVWVASAMLDALFQVSFLSSWGKGEHLSVTFLEFKQSSFQQAKVAWLVALSVPMGVMIMFALMTYSYLEIGLHKIKARVLSHGCTSRTSTQVNDAVVSESVVNLSALENVVEHNDETPKHPHETLGNEAQVNSAAPQSSEKKKNESEFGQINQSLAVKYHKDYSINVLCPPAIFFDDLVEICSVKDASPSEKVSPTKSVLNQHPRSTITNDPCKTQLTVLTSKRERNDSVTQRIHVESEGQIIRKNKETFPSGFEKSATEKLFCLEDGDISLKKEPTLLTFSTEGFSDMLIIKQSFKRKRRSQSELSHIIHDHRGAGQLTLLSFIDLNQNNLNQKTTRKCQLGIGNATDSTPNLRKSSLREHSNTPLQKRNEIGAYYNVGMNIEEGPVKMPLVSSSSEFAKKLHTSDVKPLKDDTQDQESKVESITRTGDDTVSIQMKRRRRQISQAETNLVKSKISVLLCATAYIVCYIPFLVEIILANSGFDIAADSRSVWFHFFATYFILLNDICSPVLYCLKCDNFYRASVSLLKIVCKKFKRENLSLNQQQS